jgi:hypothetical protein
MGQIVEVYAIAIVEFLGPITRRIQKALCSPVQKVQRLQWSRDMRSTTHTPLLSFTIW